MGGDTTTMVELAGPDVHVSLDGPRRPERVIPAWIPVALVAILVTGAGAVLVSATEAAPSSVVERMEAPLPPPAALPGLAWEQVAILDTTRLFDVDELAGTVWAFGRPLNSEGGMRAWSMTAEGSWQDRGPVVPPELRIEVVDTGPGWVVAAGVDAFPYRVDPPPVMRAVVVSVSANGTDWTTRRLTPPVNGARPIGVAVADSYAVVVAEVGQVILPAMIDSIGADWERVLAENPDTTYLSVEDTWVRAYGPAGFLIEEWPVAALGITGATGRTDVIAWRTEDFQTWRLVPGFPLEAVETVFAVGDGRMVAAGIAGGKPVTLISSDATNWTELAPPPAGTRVVPWGDRVLAMARTRPAIYELNAARWREITADRLLPIGTYGEVVGATGGEAGFFALLGGPEWRTSRHGDGVVEGEGGRLVMAERGTSFAVVDEQGRVVFQHSSRLQPGNPLVSFDPATQLLVVGGGEVGTNVTAPLSAFGPFPPRPVPKESQPGVGGRFVMSSDGIQWSVIGAANFGDPQGVPVPVYAGADFVLAAGQPAAAPAITDRFGRPVEVLAPVELWVGRPG